MSGSLSLDLERQQVINKEFPPQYLRLFAYVISAVVMIAAIWANDLATSLWWAPLVALVYPSLSHLFTSHWRHRYENRVNSILIVVDTMLCGGAIVLFQFNPVLSLFLFFIVSAGSVTIGGIFGWMVCLCTLVLGLIAGLLIIGAPQLINTAPSMITLTCAMAGATLFSSALGFFSFKQARTLMAFQTELRNRQREAAKLSRKLSKYLPPQVWGSIFSGQTEAKLQTQRKKLTVFFSDIKGFAEISEELQPEALTDLLNSYFTEMSRIALKYGGTIDKFVGDAILIFFGDPSSRGQKQDAAACVLMALEMRKKMKLLRQQWLKEGISKPLQVRMGINTGYCTVGNFGAESRMDYTIIGREVNLASRLESVAQPGEILIAESTYNLVRDVIMCRDRGQINVKGFTKTVAIFEVVDHRKELGATQSFLEYELDGFTMFVDIDKIRNYEKDNVVEALEEAAKRIRNKLIV